MRELRAAFCQEPDPSTRQEIFDRLFLLMAARCRQLVELIPNEQDTQQLNAMIVELNAIVQERSAAIEMLFTATEESRVPGRPASPGTPAGHFLHKIASAFR